MGAHGLAFQGVGFEPVGDGGCYVAETRSPYGLARHIVDASTGELMENGREPLRALAFFLTPIDPVKLAFPFAAAIRTAEVRSGGKAPKGHATTAQDRHPLPDRGVSADGIATLLDVDASKKSPSIDRVNGTTQ
ncbi:hypothetical protein E6C67_36885 (plasmid) [Azospirillum sp. TSA2s]|uniref:hypothetical protein n=1 Tax=Azospirillum sp. TSA2s TaxID=709810 RepID=UPI0010A9F07D|nr:hypothetical protein [Azospirillum sp. TSA2s]QCG99352.1 hypothetical protein E6C67_36885 [Azospirillum sp. TSA2s]